MNDLETPSNAAAHGFDFRWHGHPNDVVEDPRLTREEKRALLASWASDENAVANLPTLRQLPDGSIVKLEVILDALKVLDAQRAVGSPWRARQPRQIRSFPRQRGFRLWRRYGRHRDDDDDPPPCPAYAARPPKDSGGPAFAVAEAIPA
jgi:hypothetical protein